MLPLLVVTNFKFLLGTLLSCSYRGAGPIGQQIHHGVRRITANCIKQTFDQRGRPGMPTSAMAKVTNGPVTAT
jgi:hypothetical protein